MTNSNETGESQWGFVERSCLSALDTCGGSLTAWDIAVVTGQSVRLVKAYLMQLREERVVDYKDGMWHLANEFRQRDST